MMNTISVQLPLLPEALLCAAQPVKTDPSPLSPTLHDHWLHPEQLPPSIRESPTIMRILNLLEPLHWQHLPERDLKSSFRFPPIPYAALAAAELIRLNESRRSLKQLRQFLSEHPGFISLLGCPAATTAHKDGGFSTRPKLPTQRHMARMLRMIPNDALQCLLADRVDLMVKERRARGLTVGECISLDTKHILAWVKQNNPKAYVAERFNKDKQPVGDPDCRLGCKRRRNVPEASPTPQHKPVSAKGVSLGEFYWGYGSGVVVTKVPDYGEFVIAELTQPFDKGDLSYFFPLLRQTEPRLGHKPRFGTFDAAFDAWYGYAYFSSTCETSPTAGFAAVPCSGKGGMTIESRQFSPDGLPICKAGLPMPLQFAFTDRTSCLVEHERGKYVCPLRFPTQTANTCPVHHKQWKQSGRTAMMPTSIGAHPLHRRPRQ